LPIFSIEPPSQMRLNRPRDAPAFIALEPNGGIAGESRDEFSAKSLRV